MKFIVHLSCGHETEFRTSDAAREEYLRKGQDLWCYRCGFDVQIANVDAYANGKRRMREERVGKRIVKDPQRNKKRNIGAYGAPINN